MAIEAVGKPYEPAREGIHHNVEIVGVEDLGMVTTIIQGESVTKPRILATFRLQEIGSSGQPIEIRQRYTNSTYHLAKLPPVFKAATKRTLRLGDNLEELVGKFVDVLVVHNVGADGNTYNNVDKVLPLETEADKRSEERIAQATAKVKQVASEHDAKVRRNRKTNGKGNGKPDPTSFNPKDLEDADVRE